MSLGWPGLLPEPRLDGATATYPEVFNGVDLRLTADAEGFQRVLVVKSAEAAANPALDRMCGPSQCGHASSAGEGRAARRQRRWQREHE